MSLGTFTQVSQSNVRSRNDQSLRWPICLWLVDDNAALRGLLVDLLGGHDSIHCPRSLPSAEALLEELQSGPSPDVILMDLNMGGMSGIEAIPAVRALAPEARLFIMTTFYDGDQESRALAAGAAGFMLKSAPVEQILSELLETPQTRIPAPNRLATANVPDETHSTASPNSGQGAAWLPLVPRLVDLVRSVRDRKRLSPASNAR